MPDAMPERKCQGPRCRALSTRPVEQPIKLVDDSREERIKPVDDASRDAHTQPGGSDHSRINGNQLQNRFPTCCG